VTDRIIDILGDRGIAATFFVQGRWVEAYPDVAGRIVPAGHLVGNHSHYHARMPLLSATGFRSDVRTAGTIIEDRLGVDPRPWFRCPFGAGADRPRVHERLAALGYRDVGWDVDPRDWFVRRPRPLAESVHQRAVERGDGAILLFHGWPAVTPLALPELIDRLRDDGAEFVRIDALPELPVSPAEPAGVATALEAAPSTPTAAVG
jgi:peptidoglycan/xylan/chitin deacetylase (PgdA/CDA1 family)